jgi:hypothetical protein
LRTGSSSSAIRMRAMLVHRRRHLPAPGSSPGAGLDPAIHRIKRRDALMDARVKPAHDESDRSLQSV